MRKSITARYFYSTAFVLLCSIALMGFIQMGGGFLAGSLAALVGTPLQAFGLIIPAMELLAVASYALLVSVSRGRGSRSFG